MRYRCCFSLIVIFIILLTHLDIETAMMKSNDKNKGVRKVTFCIDDFVKRCTTRVNHNLVERAHVCERIALTFVLIVRTMTVWERMRNPCGWRGGAKQISVDAMIPLFAVPLLAVVAAQSFLCTIVIFLATPILVYYLHHNFLRFLLRTKFFLMWTITSVLMLMVVFEVSVVPLLEILPEENLVFILCVVGGIWCGYQIRLKADCAAQEGATDQGLELGEGSGELCVTCRRRAPAKAYHCRMCQTCILNREYHCKWLDCCIGSSNLRWYLGCLFFSAIAFIYGSNLTMTSVCHPFILIGTVLLPDDCSDVYHQLDIALCFVSALYSLLVGLVVFCYLIHHLWLIYLGTTSNERRLRTSRSQYDHGMLKNVSRLFCCKS